MSPLRRWRRVRWKVSERIAHTIPNVVTEYPFESFVAVVGLVIGLPLLTGIARPESLALLLPTAAYLAYGVALTLGAVTVAVALHRHRHPSGLASGLQLLGGAFCVYALAVVAVAGWVTAWAAFAAFIALGVVCLGRAFHFRRIVEIQRGALRLSRRS